MPKVLELKKEIERGLLSIISEETEDTWNTCPYCNHKLNEFGLCPLCDLGIGEIDPDEYEEFKRIYFPYLGQWT